MPPLRAKFADEPGPDGHARPYLWLQVTGLDEQRERILGLVDSGADRSVLPRAYAELLGYGPDDLEWVSVEQAGRPTRIAVALKPVTAIVPGAPNEPIPLRPAFANDVVNALWGREDFMGVFSVAIYERDQQFALFAG